MTMTRGLSIYLDLLRFGLAVLVWLCHSTFRGYTGHPFALWFIFPYGLSAVMGFFVLSGFVIAHVTRTTEKEPIAYAIARVSRLYSVVIPALLLTAFCDWAATLTNPPFDGPVLLEGGQAARYLVSFFMLNNFWIFAHDPFPNGMIPGTNGPFWSLSFELTYYVVFGLFLTRNRLVLACGGALVLLLAGRYIIELFPLWLLGVAIYRYQRDHTLPVSLAAVLFPLSVLGAAWVGWQREGYDYDRGLPLGIDYGIGLLMAVNILAASSLSRWFSIMLGWCEPAIRWLGGLTFVIYLCHYPLLKLFAAFPIGEAGSARQHIWLFGGSFVVMAVIGYATNHGRRYLRTALRSLAGRSGSSATGTPVASDLRPTLDGT